MKQADTEKMLTVLLKCKCLLSPQILAVGLHDPFEFLYDIKIDAPHADFMMALVIAALVREGILPLPLLLQAPDMFKSNPNSAKFAAVVVKMISPPESPPSEEHVEVVQNLVQKDGEKATDLIDQAKTTL
mmetsp:Transcript_21846/g.50399  ORF Transcript_21846/g.50399 Transcript_21846/m.50399 type:complete len:130 (+) Transcript_21846:440-829(+)